MVGGLIYDYILKNFKYIPKEGLVQLYNLNNLWKDITLSINSNLQLINFATEPIKIEELTENIFKYQDYTKFKGLAPYYDMRTKHSKIWGKKRFYIYSKLNIMKDISLFYKNFKKSLH